MSESELIAIMAAILAAPRNSDIAYCVQNAREILAETLKQQNEKGPVNP